MSGYGPARTHVQSPGQVPLLQSHIVYWSHCSKPHWHVLEPPQDSLNFLLISVPSTDVHVSVTGSNLE
jgi:hypothetical protein